MTLPEHAICSLMIAQLGVRSRLGTCGVLCVTIAGIAPDLDTAARLFGEEYFWSLHHALGHNLLSISMVSALIAGTGNWFLAERNLGYLFGWCWIAAAVHCLTDALYWWGIQPLWPFWSFTVCLDLIEYLDLVVLGIWLLATVLLYSFPRYGVRIAGSALSVFAGYVSCRAVLPQPTGVLELVTGGWMYAAPQGTPVLDWW